MTGITQETYEFKARTRLRGEVTYREANWIKDPASEEYRVKFLEGPHNGNTYPESMCAIAMDEKWKLKQGEKYG